MPTLTRWFLRAAMLHLVAGLAVGLMIAIPDLAWLSGAFRPIYIHLLVLGWATQMIFGVGYWMFPRREPLDVRAFDWLGWTCFACLNLGIGLRAVAEPMLALRASPLAATGAMISAVLQFAAVTAFVVLAWPRVMSR